MSEIDINKMATSMLHFLKNIFTTNIQYMMLLQDQSLRILTTLINHGLTTHQEARKILEEWAVNSRIAAVDFQKKTEESFEKLAQFLDKQ